MGRKFGSELPSCQSKQRNKLVRDALDPMGRTNSYSGRAMLFSVGAKGRPLLWSHIEGTVHAVSEALSGSPTGTVYEAQRFPNCPVFKRSFAGPQWARWSNRSRPVHIGPGLRAGLLVPFPCSPLSCGGRWSTLVWKPPRCWALYKFFLCSGQGWCQSAGFWKWFCETPVEIEIIKSS